MIDTFDIFLTRSACSAKLKNCLYLLTYLHFSMKWVTNIYWILFTGRPGEHQPAVGGISPQWDLVSMMTSSIWNEIIIIIKVKHQSYLLFNTASRYNCTTVELLKLGGWEVSDKHILRHWIWYKNWITYDLKKKISSCNTIYWYL